MQSAHRSPRWRSRFLSPPVGVVLSLLGFLILASCSGAGSEDTTLCPIGADGCPCSQGGACDPGLACAGDVCVDPGCPVGSLLCACDHGYCGEGLICDENTCRCPEVGGPEECPNSDTNSANDDFVFDPDFEVFRCFVPVNCTIRDEEACVCYGCLNDGECGNFEDCVCPDCQDMISCHSKSCSDNGSCEPEFEGCSCRDCWTHPACD